MNYNDIKTQAGDKYDELLEECGAFWAFSMEQFRENKTPLKEGEKYARIGAGGFVPKSNVRKLLDGMDKIDDWKREQVKKLDDEKVILYELNNYEAFYSGGYEPALEALQDLGYTEGQVSEVFKKHRNPTDYLEKANEHLLGKGAAA